MSSLSDMSPGTKIKLSQILIMRNIVTPTFTAYFLLERLESRKFHWKIKKKKERIDKGVLNAENRKEFTNS